MTNLNIKILNQMSNFEIILFNSFPGLRYKLEKIKIYFIKFLNIYCKFLILMLLFP